MFSLFTDLASTDGVGWVWFRLWEGRFAFKTTSIGERFQDRMYGLTTRCKKKFVDFTQKNVWISKFNKNRILLETNFLEILIFYKSFLGSCEVPHKIWAQSVQPFGHTDTQAKYQYIDALCINSDFYCRKIFMRIKKIYSEKMWWWTIMLKSCSYNIQKFNTSL